MTTADLWYETMSRVPHDKTALINAETGQEYTFAEVEEYSNKVANWALTVGVKSRDVVALFMEKSSRVHHGLARPMQNGSSNCLD